MSNKKPTAPQVIILSALAAVGALEGSGITATRADLDDRMSTTAWRLGLRMPGINTWVAVYQAGWVSVDRGTPDNRGGIEREYRHTLTQAGQDANARYWAQAEGR